MKKFNLREKIVESNKKEPDMDVLKKNRKSLSKEERKEVMSRGAVWHHGPKGEETPAVWKSIVNGKEWFVCNTHRAYQCKPTLKGAINSYDFIETTADDKSNLVKVAGRRRIKDRGIKWEPTYHERSKKLKERFDKQLGGGSYMRWEGHDYTTDSDYFIVVGPAMTKDLKKRFFSGIKKLPDDPKAKIYAPAGEYFISSSSAFSHANQKWGVPYPKGAPNFTTNDLARIDIPRHVKG